MTNPKDPESLLPAPPNIAAVMPDEALASFMRSLADPKYAERAHGGAVTMLRLLEPIRIGLRQHEEKLVMEARRQGATWQDIGDALGIARTNAHSRHRHIAADLREGQ
jgi:hypothetical protein